MRFRFPRILRPVNGTARAAGQHPRATIGGASASFEIEL